MRSYSMYEDYRRYIADTLPLPRRCDRFKVLTGARPTGDREVTLRDGLAVPLNRTVCGYWPKSSESVKISKKLDKKEVTPNYL